MPMVDKRSLVVGLVLDQAFQQNIDGLKHMHNLGGSILTVAETTNEEITSCSKVFIIESGLPAWAHPVLLLPALPLMTHYRAMSRGQNPDQALAWARLSSLNRWSTDRPYQSHPQHVRRAAAPALTVNLQIGGERRSYWIKNTSDRPQFAPPIFTWP